MYDFYQKLEEPQNFVWYKSFFNQKVLSEIHMIQKNSHSYPLFKNKVFSFEEGLPVDHITQLSTNPIDIWRSRKPCGNFAKSKDELCSFSKKNPNQACENWLLLIVILDSFQFLSFDIEYFCKPDSSTSFLSKRSFPLEARYLSNLET